MKEKAKFTRLIKEKDIEGINREITDEKVELQVLERLRKKATSYGRDPALPDDQQEQGPLKVNVDAVVSLYKDWVRVKQFSIGVNLYLSEADSSRLNRSYL